MADIMPQPPPGAGFAIARPDVDPLRFLSRSRAGRPTVARDEAPMTAHAPGRLTGKPALPFSLRDAEARFHRLADYRGQWLLLVFHRHLG